MKRFLIIILFISTSLNLFALKKDKIDSLENVLKHTPVDTIKILTYLDLASEYSQKTDYEKVKYYSDLSLKLSRNTNFKKGTILSLIQLSGYNVRKQNRTRALNQAFEAYKLSQNDPTFKKENLSVLLAIAFIYTSFDDYREAIKYRVAHYKGWEELINDQEYRKISKDLNKDSLTLSQSIASLAFYYFKINDYDSSLYYGNKALSFINKISQKDPTHVAYPLSCIAQVERQKGENLKALSNFRKCLNLAEKSKIKKNQLTISYKCNWEIALIKRELNEIDSSIWYAEKAFLLCKELNWDKDLLQIEQLLANNYIGIDNEKAIKHFKSASILNQKLNDKATQEKLQMLTAHEEERQYEIAERIAKENELRKKQIEYALIALSIVIIILSFIILSKTIITSERVNKFLGSLILLFIFEFFNLLSGPYVGELTENIPSLTFTSAIIIALILSPMHGQLEKWLERKMLKKTKNKKI